MVWSLTVPCGPPRPPLNDIIVAPHGVVGHYQSDAPLHVGAKPENIDNYEEIYRKGNVKKKDLRGCRGVAHWPIGGERSKGHLVSGTSAALYNSVPIWIFFRIDFSKFN